MDAAMLLLLKKHVRRTRDRLRMGACENDAAGMRGERERSGASVVSGRGCVLVYVNSRMLIPIAMHATDTHGLNRSPMRAHFQKVPRKLRHDPQRQRSSRKRRGTGQSENPEPRKVRERNRCPRRSSASFRLLSSPCLHRLSAASVLSGDRRCCSITSCCSDPFLCASSHVGAYVCT